MSQRVKGLVNIQIRQMSEDDLEEVLAIDRRVVASSRALTYSDPVEDFLGGDVSLSWVAEVDEKVVGFIFCRLADPGTPGGKVAWIQLIGIAPECQHQGLGKRLLEVALSHAPEQGVTRVHVMADRHDEALGRFFNSLGFKQGTLINYYKRVD